MKELCTGTLYRMRKTKGIKIAMGLTYIAAIFYFICGKMVADGSLPQEQAGSITGLGDAMIIWLFASLAIGLLIGSDFENKTIHGAIGYGRKKIVANYVIVSSLCVLLFVFPYTLGSAVLIGANADMAGAEGTVISIYMSNVLEYTKESTIWKLVLSYIAYAIVYIGQLSVCIPVAIKCKKSVVVTAFGFFFGMTTALVSTLAGKVDVLEKIYQFTPYYYGIEKLGINAETGDMCMGIVVSIVFTVLMGLLSWALLRKSDIK